MTVMRVERHRRARSSRGRNPALAAFDIQLAFYAAALAIIGVLVA